MKNKNLIKSIKSDVKKQIQSDIKNSVVKEIYGSSKKEMKKLRKQILSEVQRDLFGKQNKSKKTTETTEITKELIEKNTRLKDLYGFDFDSKKMGALVTGDKEKIKELGLNGKPSSLLNEALKSSIKKEKNKMTNNIGDDSIMSMFPTQSGQFTHPNGNVTYPMGMPSFPKPINVDDILRNINKTNNSIGTKMVKVPTPELTEEKKEEITLFIGKLKLGVSKLREDEKNINYRKKYDNTYTFSFERKADFDLKFDLDLNMNTYRADIVVFEFKIDGFKFDKKLLETIDIVKVLDLVGFNMNGYIDEISGVNSIDIDRAQTPTTKVKKTISARTKVENLINDPKLINLLTKNEITNYGQLMKVEDLTSLNGIGAKTAEKINEQIKSYKDGILQ